VLARAEGARPFGEVPDGSGLWVRDVHGGYEP
jgi:hypothetical protein